MRNKKNKTNYLFCMMLMILFSVCAHAEKVNVNLQVGGIDKDNMDVPLPKSPILTPEMEQDGNTLYLSSIHADYTLCLLDENEDVIYTTYVPASVSSVALPSYLSGTYEIRLLTDSVYFYGWITL